MNVVESQWWIIELPDEWDADQDEDTILISDEDGVGEIAITTLEKETGLVDEAELQDYMNDVVEQFGPAELAQVAELDGYYIAYKEDGDAVREWYLRYDNLLVLITYSCDDENAGMDDGAVNEILDTLFIKVEEPEA